jgi:hypothetical protein
VSFVDALLAASGVRQTAAGAEWPRMRSLCLERQLSGNDLPDAWLAACVMHHGEHVVTFGRAAPPPGRPAGHLTVTSGYRLRTALADWPKIRDHKSL